MPPSPSPPPPSTQSQPPTKLHSQDSLLLVERYSALTPATRHIDIQDKVSLPFFPKGPRPPLWEGLCGHARRSLTSPEEIKASDGCQDRHTGAKKNVNLHSKQQLLWKKENEQQTEGNKLPVPAPTPNLISPLPPLSCPLVLRPFHCTPVPVSSSGGRQALRFLSEGIHTPNYSQTASLTRAAEIWIQLHLFCNYSCTDLTDQKIK